VNYVYAVGDIHGCSDLLERATVAIAAHAAGRVGTVVFLGDYVDRGPDSRGVVEALMRRPTGVTCLKGNHELMMVNAYRSRDPEVVARWLKDGGDQTLRSYGWRRGEPDLSIIPEAHIKWMEDLPFIVADDHRIYVHAGLAPGVKAHKQVEAHCLWIRDRFLLADAEEFPAHIVHGHTPRWFGKPDLATPERLPHRTNLDTGAHLTGLLSVGVFVADAPGPPIEVISIRREPSHDSGTATAALGQAFPAPLTAVRPLDRSGAEVALPTSPGTRAAPPRRGPNIPTRAATAFHRDSWRR
jgi:serine/threonine protein phosphatase 1